MDIRIEVVPLVGDGGETAQRIFDRWSSQSHTFWLDSASDSGTLGRFSFLGTDPYEVVRCSGGVSRRPGGVSRRPDDVWDRLAKLAEPIFRRTLPPSYPAPFAGGLVGYVGYDAGLEHVDRVDQVEREMELSSIAPASFGAYDAIVCVDHAADQLYIVSTGLPLAGEAAHRRAEERLAWLRQEVEAALRDSGTQEACAAQVESGTQEVCAARVDSGPQEVCAARVDSGIQEACAAQVESGTQEACAIEDSLTSARAVRGSRPSASNPSHTEAPPLSPSPSVSRSAGSVPSPTVSPSAPSTPSLSIPFVPTGLQSTFTREEYIRHVEEVLDMIDAGDVEQVNLSQRFTVPTHLSGPDLYARLRKSNPAPFAAALHTDGGWILSSSPERFVRIQGNDIEMRPIKGTRPRGIDAATDEAHRIALQTSAKDARELDMIEDLTREELARICLPGSVHVPEAKVCEAYETVFHLVSTVAGRLAPGANPVACVQQLFPGGSITGRPKRRAMEIIDDLEPVPRGVYTGAIGYFGVGGNVDLNVAIRTMVWQEGRVHFHVGGAVVAGSSPEDEYDETLAKAGGMMRALFPYKQ